MDHIDWIIDGNRKKITIEEFHIYIHYRIYAPTVFMPAYKFHARISPHSF